MLSHFLPSNAIEFYKQCTILKQFNTKPESSFTSKLRTGNHQIIISNKTKATSCEANLQWIISNSTNGWRVTVHQQQTLLSSRVWLICLPGYEWLCNRTERGSWSPKWAVVTKTSTCELLPAPLSRLVTLRQLCITAIATADTPAWRKTTSWHGGNICCNRAGGCRWRLPSIL